MDDLERDRWTHVIHGLIVGEYVELLYPNVRRAKHAQQTCMSLMTVIGLPFDASLSVNDMWVRVSGMVRFLPGTNPMVHCSGWR